MAINHTRVAEMLSDLEDFETEFNEFEESFLATIQTNLSDYDSKFKFFGEQEKTFQKIYDHYCKKPQY